MSPELRDWAAEEKDESELSGAINDMALAVDQSSKAVRELLKIKAKNFMPILREMNLYNESVLSTLQRRNQAQYV